MKNGLIYIGLMFGFGVVIVLAVFAPVIEALVEFAKF